MNKGKNSVTQEVESFLWRRFPEAEEYDIEIEAMRITLPLKIGSSAEFTREWKTMIRKQLEQVRQLTNLFLEANKVIGNLHSVAQIQISKAWINQDQQVLHVKDYKKSIKEITEQIDHLKEITRTAETSIFLRFPNHGIEQGRKRKDVETMCAWNAGLAFQYFKKRAPTITYDAYLGKSGGEFLEFVADLFEILDLKASPEACAKKAVKAIKEKTRPATG